MGVAGTGCGGGGGGDRVRAGRRWVGRGRGGELGTVWWRAKLPQHTQGTLRPWHHATGVTLV